MLELIPVAWYHVLEDGRGKVQTCGQSFNATMVAARQQGMCSEDFAVYHV